MDKEMAGPLLVNADSAVVFEQVFKTHFKDLHRYAISIVKDDAQAEEMVQNVFLKLWEKKEQLAINGPVAAYLYKSVYYECLNALKHNKVKDAYRSHVVHTTSEHFAPTDAASLRDLRQGIDAALNELPEQCRTVFQLSRYQDLKYRNIAEHLGISVKTVENQMGKAMKMLRQKLAHFLPVLWLIIFYLKNNIFLI